MPPNVEAFHTTDVLMGRQPMPPGSFLGNLSAAAWPHFVHTWGPDARTYQRGEELPLGPGNQHVYIVMGGCVIQERFPSAEATGLPRCLASAASGRSWAKRSSSIRLRPSPRGA